MSIYSPKEDFYHIYKYFRIVHLCGKVQSFFSSCIHPGFLTVFFYRIAHFFYHHKLICIAQCFSSFGMFLSGADIGFGAEIGAGLNCLHPSGIVIGHQVRIGKNCLILAGAVLGLKRFNEPQHPTVGDNVKIGAGAKILGNVHIGDRAWIGANSVVTKDVAAGEIFYEKRH